MPDKKCIWNYTVLWGIDKSKECHKSGKGKYRENSGKLKY